MTTPTTSEADQARQPRFRGGLVGAGAAACAVCCAAPLMVLLGIGATGAAATALAVAFAGLVFGLVVAAATVAAVVAHRRQGRRNACADTEAASGPMPLPLGSRPDEP